MKFNIQDHLIQIRGGQKYLPVAARLIWFREEHPDWRIETEPVHIDWEHGVAMFRASVLSDTGVVMATATKVEHQKHFVDFVEKAETGAIGRALALCGYGTQFAPEFDEGERYADSPYPLRPRTEPEPADPEPARPTSTSNGEIPPCARCGKPLRKPQYDLSMAKFGQPLCPDCQRQANR